MTRKKMFFCRQDQALPSQIPGKIWPHGTQFWLLLFSVRHIFGTPCFYCEKELESQIHLSGDLSIRIELAFSVDIVGCNNILCVGSLCSRGHTIWMHPTDLLLLRLPAMSFVLPSRSRWSPARGASRSLRRSLQRDRARRTRLCNFQHNWPRGRATQNTS